ncbi:hypothetical protein N9309_02570 [Acidimicrobiia bacterium]|nr:hypothetical protein [Acidimicrobiia bacterium]
MKKFNLLYCFDEGYNLQTYASIYSIAKNLTKSKLDIYIIHKNPDTFSYYSKKIKNLENISEVYIFKFNKNIGHYPNLKNKHVSEATYYRLFLSEYIPEHLEHLIYLDSDVFCVNDPEYVLNYSVENLISSDLTISAATEVYKTSNNLIFSKLGLKNVRYFNAGVMVIDFQEWLKEVQINDVVAILNENQKLLENWDQDLLNIIFDGKYLELTNFLNYRINFSIPDYFIEIYPIFIHFAGNHKPWTLEGSYDDTSHIYFNLLEELKVKSYNIKLKSRKIKAIGILIKKIVTLKIFKNKNSFKLLIENLKAIGRN